MKNLSLDGFLGIPFGSSIKEVTVKIEERQGVLDIENSDNDSLIFNNVTFAGYKTELLLILFHEEEFAKALIYIKPKLESQVIGTYKSICDGLSDKYYITDKDFETYDYPYEENDGHTETGISLGKIDFSSFWNFSNSGNEDDYISVIITEDLEILITYENGYLAKLMSEKIKNINSADF